MSRRGGYQMNEQILLVEDDDAIADVVRLHLEEAGYGVHREADGRRAMALIDRRAWDLVLLDVMLPGADGWEVCRHLRARHADVSVIMVSARSAESQRVHGLDLGADDYIAKPFSMVELVARVRARLRRVEQARTRPMDLEAHRFGAFRLDARRRELTRCGQIVPLTQREYELLLFLVAQAGRAFSRNELLQWVWGDGFDGYEHTVNSHINRLRAKIEDEPGNPHHIVTVWGVGYRFELGAPE